MKVAFVLLAHEPPEMLRPLIETLLASGSDIYVHHDANSPHNLEQETATWELDRFSGRLYCADRVKVSWGEWSIVQGTLNCLYMAQKQGYGADYFMLISGSCMPVKPVRLLEEFLESCGGLDFIEVVNATKKRWITQGIQQERWELYHYLNWREHSDLFSCSIALQKKLNIKRTLPLNHTPFMGSQWWCLRSSTIEAILALMDAYPELCRFYRRTWVPDELFFQTMVGNLVSLSDTSSQILTRYKFNSWGVPRAYYDDDLPELLAEESFFARKISHRALYLKKALSENCLLSESRHRQLIEDICNPHALALRERVLLQKKMRDLSWFGLATQQENEYDYIKSIPNDMIVIVSANTLSRKRAVDELRVHSGLVIYGDILNPIELDFGITDRIAGYRRQDVKLARHKWHLYLGELAFHAKDKTVVFSLGVEEIQFLNVLRWKDNLSLIIVDEDDFSGHGVDWDKQKSHTTWRIVSLMFDSKISHLLASGRSCQIYRHTLGSLRQIINSSRTDPSMDGFYHQLSEHHVESNLPTVSFERKDRYEHIKSIGNPIIVVYSDENEVAADVLMGMAGYTDLVIFSDIFNSRNQILKDIDWYHYIEAMSYIAGKRMIAFAISSENRSFLETLRWNDKLAVIIAKTKGEVLDSSLSGLNNYMRKDSYNNLSFQEVRGILQNRACQNYYLNSADPATIKGVFDKFSRHIQSLNRNKNLDHGTRDSELIKRIRFSINRLNKMPKRR